MAWSGHVPQIAPFLPPRRGFLDLLAQTAFTTQSPPAAVSRLTSQSLLHPGGNYYALVIHRERSRMTYAARSVYEQPRQARFEKLFHVAVGLALDLNFFRRILDFSSASPLQPTFSLSTFHLDTTYVGANESWSHERADSYPQVFSMLNETRNHPSSSRSLPVAPFRVLDAPNLRNDFYCSTLAYSQSFQTLAVGLGNVVYTWSDKEGVRSVNGHQSDGVWLTTLSFSSEKGDKGVFAAGRSDCSVVVMSLAEAAPRFEIQQPHAVSCLSWRSCPVLRQSCNPFSSDELVPTEDLVVGDESGTLYYYVVEWSRDLAHHWPGSITLVARISVHRQQICGLAWSADGELFASGANDNLCALFQVCEVLAPHDVHQAAVKAIAFCPWLKGLVATGGGSNDKQIHFFHTSSGSSLATISVAAQVTSLIWSSSKREIAATFGYAHPEHPYRIAVFSWPDCSRIAVIPWETELRALHAVPYSRVFKKQRNSDRRSTVVNECIVVASSDEKVKFFEVWSSKGSKAVTKPSMFRGSDILEDLQGIMKEGDVIR
ncbi:hypothetical protein UVI_02027570 [Ustilaginoidea virens]|uniref:WD domain-containing protein n=1 Tax=Ustilaginoidea virens TaxID=1159556 RepID=A0A1B5KVI7_USTVR|nr:hypothetical protein UVI_02027570 [Ustilaginoidea virens]